MKGTREADTGAVQDRCAGGDPGAAGQRYFDANVLLDSLSSTDEEMEANLDHWCAHIEDGNVHHLLHAAAHAIPHAHHPDYVVPLTEHQRSESLDEEALAHNVAMRVVAMQEKRASMAPLQSGPRPLEDELSAAIATFERVVSALGAESASSVGGDDAPEEEEWIARTRGSVAGQNVIARAASMAEMLRQLIAGSLPPSAEAAAEADAVLSGLVASGIELECERGSAAAVGQAAREQKRRAPPRPSEVGRADGVLAELFVEDFKEALGGDVGRFKQFRRASRDFTRGSMSATDYVGVFNDTLEGNDEAKCALAPRLVAILPAGPQSAAQRRRLCEALAAEDLVTEGNAPRFALPPAEEAVTVVDDVAMEEKAGGERGTAVASAGAAATAPASEGVRAPAASETDENGARCARATRPSLDASAPRGSLAPIAEDAAASADDAAPEAEPVAKPEAAQEAGLAAAETDAPSAVPAARASAPILDAPPALIRAAPPSPFASLAGSAAEAPAAAPPAPSAEADVSERLQLAAVTSAAAAVKGCLRPKGKAAASAASAGGAAKRLDAYAEFKRASRAYRSEMIDAIAYVRHCFSDECFATPSQRALGLEKLPVLIADDAQRQAVFQAIQQLQAEETAAAVELATAAATAAVQEQANATYKRKKQEMKRASVTELRKSHAQIAESESKVVALEQKMSEMRDELVAAEEQRVAEDARNAARAAARAAARSESADTAKETAAAVETIDKAARRVSALVEKMEDLEAKYEESLADKRRATLADRLAGERAELRREAISMEQYRRTTSKGRGAAGPFVRKICHRVSVVRRNGARRYPRELVVWSDRVVAQDLEADVAATASPGRKKRRVINWHFDRIVSVTAGSKRSKDRETSTKMTVVVKKCVVLLLSLVLYPSLPPSLVSFPPSHPHSPRWSSSHLSAHTVAIVSSKQRQIRD